MPKNASRGRPRPRASKRERHRPPNRWPQPHPGRRFGWTKQATLLGVATLVTALTVGLGASLSGGSARTATSPSIGPEGAALETGPLLGTADSTSPGSTIDGISCNAGERLAYHIHVHLEVYDHGQPTTLPLGIGVVAPRDVLRTVNGDYVQGGSCFYWLHTHAVDGIIHVESPLRTTFDLGQFFDEWQQPLGPGTVAVAQGAVTAFVDGRRYQGDPRTIPLLRHEVIQLDVGGPVIPPQPFTFPPGL
jgi:hypothetical protein